MKREVKFRAWDYEMPNYPIKYDADSIDTIEFNFGENLHYINTIGLYVNAEDEVCNGFTTKHLEQFTGLQDKNGVDIYEGDILEFDGMLDDVEDLRTIRDIRTDLQYNGIEQGEEYRYEVIGNIHQKKL